MGDDQSILLEFLILLQTVLADKLLDFSSGGLGRASIHWARESIVAHLVLDETPEELREAVLAKGVVALLQVLHLTVGVLIIAYTTRERGLNMP